MIKCYLIYWLKNGDDDTRVVTLKDSRNRRGEKTDPALLGGIWNAAMQNIGSENGL